MSQFSALFQTLGTITQFSDKITTILIAVIAFFLLDKQFHFSENYRQNELHGRLKDLLIVSYSGNDVSKRVPSGVTLEVLESELLSLEAELSELRSDSLKAVKSEDLADVGSRVEKIVNDSTVFNARSSQEPDSGAAKTMKSDSIATAAQKNHGCLESFRISHCVLTVLTSGFWFFLYGFASFFYIFIRKITMVREDEMPMTWSSAGLAAVAVVSLLGPFVVLAAGFAASLPEFYSHIFNYVLNVAISGFLLQAVTKVFASFFVGNAAPVVDESTKTPIENQKSWVEGNFWDRLRWLLGISDKK